MLVNTWQIPRWTFSGRWIGRGVTQSWPPRSPDLTHIVCREQLGVWTQTVQSRGTTKNFRNCKRRESWVSDFHFSVVTFGNRTDRPIRITFLAGNYFLAWSNRTSCMCRCCITGAVIIIRCSVVSATFFSSFTDGNIHFLKRVLFGVLHGR
jgi:hypothetical protein